MYFNCVGITVDPIMGCFVLAGGKAKFCDRKSTNKSQKWKVKHINSMFVCFFINHWYYMYITSLDYFNYFKNTHSTFKPIDIWVAVSQYFQICSIFFPAFSMGLSVIWLSDCQRQRRSFERCSKCKKKKMSWNNLTVINCEMLCSVSVLWIVWCVHCQSGVGLQNE